MEEILRQVYEAPVTLVIEVKAEGIICGSGSKNDYQYYDFDNQ